MTKRERRKVRKYTRLAYWLARDPVTWRAAKDATHGITCHNFYKRRDDV